MNLSVIDEKCSIMAVLITNDGQQQHPFCIVQRPLHLSYPVLRARLSPSRQHINVYIRLSVNVDREKREVHHLGTDQSLLLGPQSFPSRGDLSGNGNEFTKK